MSTKKKNWKIWAVGTDGVIMLDTCGRNSKAVESLFFVQFHRSKSKFGSEMFKKMYRSPRQKKTITKVHPHPDLRLEATFSYFKTDRGESAHTPRVVTRSLPHLENMNIKEEKRILVYSSETVLTEVHSSSRRPLVFKRRSRPPGGPSVYLLLQCLSQSLPG